MKLRIATLAGGLSLLALLAAPSIAATPPKSAALKAAEAKSANVSVEPAAQKALNDMGAYLRTLKKFTVKVYSSTEDVLDSGEKIQTGNQIEYVVQTPNKIFAELSADGDRHSTYYYDGSIFTVRSGNNNYYAQAPFTGTITQLLNAIYDNYGIDLPLQDLFRWGNPAAETGKPYQGFLIGPSKVGEWDTNHYAFRQKGVDFQVWIEKGDKPLPRKLVITSLDDPAQPQYIAIFNWNLAPDIAADRFTFVPDAKSVKIPFMTPGAPAAAAK